MTKLPSICFAAIIVITSHYSCAQLVRVNGVKSELSVSEADVTQRTAEPAGKTPSEKEITEVEVLPDDDFDEFEEEFSEPGSEEVFDPLSGYNRLMTKVNDKLYFWVLKPVAKGYAWVVPEGPRRGVNRFFTNLLFPVRFVNNVLQLKLLNAGEETLRFLTNSTVGFLGFWDPAKNWFGLEAHPEDFGQTLGFYGVGSGFHIVLPLLGPSNLRDMIGLVPDFYLNPVTWIDDWEEEYAVKALGTVNKTSLHIGEYENLKKDAIDLYPFLRDIYEQNRDKKIRE